MNVDDADAARPCRASGKNGRGGSTDFAQVDYLWRPVRAAAGGRLVFWWLAWGGYDEGGGPSVDQPRRNLHRGPGNGFCDDDHGRRGDEIPPTGRKLPPVLGRLLSGTFWLALRTPLQAVFALWTLPLIVRAIGPAMNGAYGFAWNFGFFQMLFELGMSSALQRQVSESYTKGDRAGVDRAIACGMNFYATMALVQIAALLSVAYIGLPFFGFWGNPAQVDLIVKLLWLQAFTAPCYGLSVVVSSVLQAARRYDFQPRFELAVIVLRFAVLWVGVNAGIDFFTIVILQTIVQVGLSLGPALWVMIRELGHVPGFRGARRDDYRALIHVSLYVFMIQLSVVFADKLDTIILAFAAHSRRPARTGRSRSTTSPASRSRRSARRAGR